jgi:hypothetical protein
LKVNTVRASLSIALLRGKQWRSSTRSSNIFARIKQIKSVVKIMRLNGVAVGAERRCNEPFLSLVAYLRDFLSRNNNAKALLQLRA